MKDFDLPKVNFPKKNNIGNVYIKLQQHFHTATLTTAIETTSRTDNMEDPL